MAAVAAVAIMAAAMAVAAVKLKIGLREGVALFLCDNKDRESRNSVSCQGAGSENLAEESPTKAKQWFCAINIIIKYLAYIKAQRQNFPKTLTRGINGDRINIT